MTIAFRKTKMTMTIILVRLAGPTILSRLWCSQRVSDLQGAAKGTITANLKIFTDTLDDEGKAKLSRGR